MREYLARTKPNVAFDWTRFWAYAALLFILEDRGAREAEEPLLKEGLAEFPGHPHFLSLLARRHLADGKAEEALTELKTARAALERPVRGLRPAESWLEIGLAEGCRTLGRKEEAIHWAKQARSHSPESNQGAELLARLFMESGRLAEAEEVATEMLVSASVPDPWLLLGELRQTQGRWEEADGAVKQACASGLPEEQGDELLGRMKAARVLAGTRTTSRSSPQQVQTQIQGLSLLSQGNPMKAAESFAEAVQADPANPDNYRYLALALHALGQEEQALEAWRLAARFGAARIG